MRLTCKKKIALQFQTRLAAFSPKILLLAALNQAKPKLSNRAGEKNIATLSDLIMT
jgi:hypothetical protein